MSTSSDADFSSRRTGTPRRVLRQAGGLLALFAAAGMLATSIVLVDETEFVIVERFGSIVAVYDRAGDRGLHFKLPWPVDAVRSFDRRLQMFDPPGREMFTRDRKNVTVDAYVCWKVAEPTANEADRLDERPVVRFFRGLNGVDLAESRLDSRLRSVLTTHVGRVELGDLLSTADSESGPADGESPLEEMARAVRRDVTQREGERESLRERLGIELVDVRIKRINLPAGNQQAVFERMKSERRKIADRYRSAGLAENRVIRSQADRQAGEILARADAEAERIRGEGEAEAIRILNAAHAQDPEFYRVVQTLDAYRTILNDRTTLVLSASSSLLKMLTEGVPELPEASSAPSVSPADPGLPARPATAERPANLGSAAPLPDLAAGGSGP